MYLEHVYINDVNAAAWSNIKILVSIPKRGTLKPVLSGHSEIGKTKILMTNGSLMKLETIAECSPWSILQYF